ncbi:MULTISPECIES: MFS transporter [unclassified Streptomyces]|uniref:MFS transporter n=1 Tax=unclassified Streptomyces TaxID=2593676 RepID=UPI002DD7D3DA|nr:MULTISPECIES: MFS transporter [unclassified Streptomyces]WSF85973.1 MFS transporter [Streptomyces sp. NBC_01744]WSC37742.1 MFS transporter [Streptomyces sp. NBC_01763]WSC45856.1 MFS transporter [Streptomyces sp. NBC_01762]WSC55137.1 MFS transporter [Streptomyces sp. NBC_01761]WSD25519.1 MFS transporter [Streptomyces sp. NBC_01751]
MSLLKDLRTLPRTARTLLLLGALNNIGSGLVLPFLAVYVHQVNGLGLDTAMHAVSLTAIAAIIGGLNAGRLADRIGARRTAAAHMVLSAVGVTGYALAGETWHFLLSAVIWGLGLGSSSVWNTLLATSVPAASHPVVFGSSFTLTNAALGVGGLLGGAFASVAHPMSFRLLYGANALSYLGIALAVFALRSLGTDTPTEADARQDSARSHNYLQVFTSGPFLLVLGLGLALYFSSYGQLEAGFPAFLLTSTDVGPSGIAVLFAVNTGAVICSQLVLHELIKRWKHTQTVALAAAAWSASWLLVLAATASDADFQLAVLIGGMALFACAETLYASGMPSLVNSLATPALRGRYNAAYGTATSAGFVTGPLAAGVLVSGGAGTFLVTGLSVLCAVAALVLLATTGLLVRAASAASAVTAGEEAAPDPADGHQEAVRG